MKDPTSGTELVVQIPPGLSIPVIFNLLDGACMSEDDVGDP